MFGPAPLPRTLPAALRDVTSAREEVRVSALRDLVRYAEGANQVRTEALPILTAALGDTAPQVRAAAAVGLADLSATESLPALLMHVEDDDPYVRQMAIRSLGEIGDSRAKGRLLRALADERAEVRYQAVVAYARVAEDPAEAVGAIATALRDHDPHIRTIALRVADERTEKAEHRAALESALVPLVRPMLDDISRPDALTAALFLVGHGARDEAAVGVLRRATRGELKAAAKEDVDEAFIVLGELGAKELIPEFERRLFGVGRWLGTGSPWHIRVALVLLGQKRAEESLLADLASRDVSRRHAALLAAGRARMVSARPTIEAMIGTELGAVAERVLTEIDGGSR